MLRDAPYLIIEDTDAASQYINQSMHLEYMLERLMCDHPRASVKSIEADVIIQEETLELFKEKEGYILSPRYALHLFMIWLRYDYLKKRITKDLIKTNKHCKKEALKGVNAITHTIQKFRRIDMTRDGGNLDNFYKALDGGNPVPKDDIKTSDRMFTLEEFF